MTTVSTPARATAPADTSHLRGIVARGETESAARQLTVFMEAAIAAGEFGSAVQTCCDLVLLYNEAHAMPSRDHALDLLHGLLRDHSTDENNAKYHAVLATLAGHPEHK